MGHFTLHGFKLDCIAAVQYPSQFESDNARLYNWHDWALWPKERVLTETQHPRGQADPQRQDAFWRTIIAVAEANGNGQRKYLHAQYQARYQKMIIDALEISNDFAVDIGAGGEFKEFLTRVRQVSKEGTSLRQKNGASLVLAMKTIVPSSADRNCSLGTSLPSYMEVLYPCCCMRLLVNRLSAKSQLTG